MREPEDKHYDRVEGGGMRYRVRNDPIQLPASQIPSIISSSSYKHSDPNASACTRFCNRLDAFMTLERLLLFFFLFFVISIIGFIILVPPGPPSTHKIAERRTWKLEAARLRAAEEAAAAQGKKGAASTTGEVRVVFVDSAQSALDVWHEAIDIAAKKAPGQKMKLIRFSSYSGLASTSSDPSPTMQLLLSGVVDTVHWVRSSFPSTEYEWPSWGSHSFGIGHDLSAPGSADLCLNNPQQVSSPVDSLTPVYATSKSSNAKPFPICKAKPEDAVQISWHTLDLKAAVTMPLLCIDSTLCLVHVDLDFLSAIDPCHSELADRGFSLEAIGWLRKYFADFSAAIDKECWAKSCGGDQCEQSSRHFQAALKRAALAVTAKRSAAQLFDEEKTSFQQQLFCNSAYDVQATLELFRVWLETQSAQQKLSSSARNPLVESFNRALSKYFRNFTLDMSAPEYIQSSSQTYLDAAKFSVLFGSRFVQPAVLTVSRSSGTAARELVPELEWHIQSALGHAAVGPEAVPFSLAYSAGIKAFPRPTSCQKTEGPVCFEYDMLPLRTQANKLKRSLPQFREDREL